MTETSALIAPEPQTDIHLVIISGMSGSGKSIALHALEDAGFYCVDNLPPELLLPFIEVEKTKDGNKIAIAMDARSATSLPLIPVQINALRHSGIHVTPLFLDASDETLVRRFSETRRKHPLTKVSTHDQVHDLRDAIAQERLLLAAYREQAEVIDTTMTRASQLRSQIKSLLAVQHSQLTLVFESFAFKRGVPTDADYVFDVRMLPNPFYDPSLRPLTGKDAPVQDFLRQQANVQTMQTHITQFVSHWLPALQANHRSYVTVAVGCTGGQHRSVFLTEQLAAHFRTQWNTLLRHREMDARVASKP